MKLFQCQCCGQILHFENTLCLRCGRTIGYLPDQARMVAVEPDGAHWAEAAPAGGALGGTPLWRFCHNWELSACNWMVPVPVEGEPEDFCPACRHNRTVPDLSAPENHARWQKIESAKRRLIYTLMRLGLPLPASGEGHPQPLIFDFLADSPDSGARVLTGHAGGLVTIALIEADDATREKMRTEMGEAYRTLLGHFRHEIGHYYWDLLMRDAGQVDAFRTVFGDESLDYATALQNHYRNGPMPGWEQSFVSAYATMHPWEDWAETWAHYLHMVDGLETAAALGMSIDAGIDQEDALSAEVDFDPWRSPGVQPLIRAWTPLTVALNVLNRSMGQQDSYPFALPDPVKAKLGFVHDLVRGASPDAAAQQPPPLPAN